MLGYRHAFHAGNHADVLKHMALCGCLEYMTRKEKPVFYADTHAGAGVYRLNEGFAVQNREWKDGLDRLRTFTKTEAPPALVNLYLETVESFGQEFPGEYPGSPGLAARMLRAQDSLAFFELHPADCAELLERFSRDRRVCIQLKDGYSGLKSLLPPPSRRGLVLMDPSYEIALDYDRAVESIADALRRFATGTFLIWHPLLDRPDARSLPERIAGVSDRPHLMFSLRIRGPGAGGRGLEGSGMIVFNPPWPLESSLREALPYVCRALAQDAAAWDLSVCPRT